MIWRIVGCAQGGVAFQSWRALGGAILAKSVSVVSIASRWRMQSYASSASIVPT
jgi:hypothetical protein